MRIRQRCYMLTYGIANTLQFRNCILLLIVHEYLWNNSLLKLAFFISNMIWFMSYTVYTIPSYHHISYTIYINRKNRFEALVCKNWYIGLLNTQHTHTYRNHIRQTILTFKDPEKIIEHYNSNKNSINHVIFLNCKCDNADLYIIYGPAACC